MLSKNEIDAIKGRYEEYTDTDEWEVSIDNIDYLLENLFQDIPKLLSHIAQQKSEVERMRKGLEIISENKKDYSDHLLTCIADYYLHGEDEKLTEEDDE